MAKEFVLYHYKPSKAAAILFTIGFAVTTAIHIHQSFIHRRRRAWFMIPFLIGALFEVIGYVFRVQSANDTSARTPYILQTLLILLAPALMAASTYMVLGRIIQVTDGDKFALVRRTWLTSIFVAGDVISFIAQGFGGSLLSNDKGTLKEVADRGKLGKNVILIGLWVQIVFFGFFVLVSMLFQYRARGHFKMLAPELGWKKHMYTLYAVSMIILIRSLFRVIEYVQGVDGYLYSHEVFLYVFDATLIIIAMTIMNVVHPADLARLLREKGSWNSDSEMHRLGSSPPEYNKRNMGQV